MDQLLLRRLWWLGLLGFLYRVDASLAWTRWLFLLFLAPLVADVVHLSRRAGGGGGERAVGPDLPLPGPATRGGAFLFALRCTVSDALALLNPRQRRQVLRQARGERRARARVGRWEPTPDTFVPRLDYCLPFEGDWYVANGGTTPETSHSWGILAQRYAYDFVVVGVDGRTHAGDGSRAEHYHAYGRPVRAPADGQVVEVVNNVRDAPAVGTGWLDWRAAEIGGNSVTIRHAEGEFSHLSHLVPGSITVRAGEWVLRGQEVGRCGNSGHATEPHLHFQLQDHPDVYQAVGLPVRFVGVRVAGEREPRTAYLEAGMLVRPVPPAPAHAAVLAATRTVSSPARA